MQECEAQNQHTTYLQTNVNICLLSSETTGRPSKICPALFASLATVIITDIIIIIVIIIIIINIILSIAQARTHLCYQDGLLGDCFLTTVAKFRWLSPSSDEELKRSNQSGYILYL